MHTLVNIGISSKMVQLAFTSSILRCHSYTSHSLQQCARKISSVSLLSSQHSVTGNCGSFTNFSRTCTIPKHSFTTNYNRTLTHCSKVPVNPPIPSVIGNSVKYSSYGYGNCRHYSCLAKCMKSSITSSYHAVGPTGFAVNNHGLPWSAMKKAALPWSTEQRAGFQSDHDRTTITILNREDRGPLMVSSYDQTGFRLSNSMHVIGSIALFPYSVLSWQVYGPEDITVESLSLFYLLAPKLDLIILGVGETGNKIDMTVLPFLRDKGISLEVLPTEQAVATYNFLAEEHRCVAGAFLIPAVIEVSRPELTEVHRRHAQLFEALGKDKD